MRGRKDEGRVFDRLKRVWKEAHWVRNESWAAIGMTDINGCRNGEEVWVESKDLGTRGVTPGDVLKIKNLRKSQIAWITARINAGGMVFFGILLNDELYIIHAKHMNELFEGFTTRFLTSRYVPITSLFSR